MRADALLEVRRGLHERLLRRVDARGLEEVSRTERRLRVREEALAILRGERHILSRGVLTRRRCGTRSPPRFWRPTSAISASSTSPASPITAWATR